MYGCGIPPSVHSFTCPAAGIVLLTGTNIKAQVKSIPAAADSRQEVRAAAEMSAVEMIAARTPRPAPARALAAEVAVSAEVEVAALLLWLRHFLLLHQRGRRPAAVQKSTEIKSKSDS